MVPTESTRRQLLQGEASGVNSVNDKGAGEGNSVKELRLEMPRFLNATPPRNSLRLKSRGLAGFPPERR